MCGFLGMASSTSCRETDWLTIGRDAMTHRGPDDYGAWWSLDGRVGLGHRRLSILDLSTLGHQPMEHQPRGLAVVFNGEIYNHHELRLELAQRGFRFRSHSDTEVILAAYEAWGRDCLHRFNGAFAFAVYDGMNGTVFLARDRAGEKPLFYRIEQDRLYFASELKALLANQDLPRRVDSEALDCYLSMGFVPGERCILQGYKKLPPAHNLTFVLRSGISKTERYWSLPQGSPEAKGQIDENALLDELEMRLEDSVRRQLIADVPVGILLSGGVDSSLVTAMAARHSRKVRTFSIGFPGHGSLDETHHARLIARSFDTEHTELIAEPATAALLPLLAQQFDEPIVDSSMLPTYLVTKLVRDHCKVALGGDGGDELFGGYSEYCRLIRIQRFSNKISYLPRKLISKAAEFALPMGFARSNVRTWLMALGTDLTHGLPLIASYFDPINRRRLMRGHSGHRTVAEHIRLGRIPQEPDLLERAVRMDFANYLAEDILVKVDRASLLNSLEVRAPMLDYRLVEFAFSRVPSRLKTTATEKKILLKRLAARVLPPEFDRQRKQGFSIPLTEWLKAGPFRDLFWDVLTSSDGFFDVGMVRQLLRRQERGANNSERLFALVQFELWRRHYGVSS